MVKWKKLPLVSIIVPYKSEYPWVHETVRECKKLDYPNFEIILLPDNPEDAKKYPGCKVVPTGVTNHSGKRNMGIDVAKGAVYAFIDSDAYPRKDWLRNGVRYLEDESIGLVGGPNLTPPDDTLMQQLSGDVLGSIIGAGGMAERYSVRRERDTDALPSVNMLVRKEVFDKLKEGWDETLITGEDVKVCYQVLDLGLRIRYSPEVVVYHHRRPMFAAHMEQIWNYGRDEGLLVKERGGVDRFLVLAPPLFVLWLVVGGLASIDWPEVRLLYLGSMLGYGLFVLVAGMLINFLRGPLIAISIFATHLAYGGGFLRGLFLPKKFYSADFKRKTYNK